MDNAPRRQTLTDLGGAQTGDVSSGDSAGGNIYQGIDGEALLHYLEGERNSRDAAAAAIVRLHEEIAQLRKEARRAEQDAAMERAIGMEARIKQEAATAARIASLDRRFAWLTMALLVAILILSILVWREWAGLAARAAFDALALSR